MSENNDRATLICCMVLAFLLIGGSAIGYSMYTRLLSINATVNEIRKELAPTKELQQDIQAVKDSIKKEHENSNEYFWDYGQRFVKQTSEMVRLWRSLRKLQEDFEAFKTAQGVTVTDGPDQPKEPEGEQKSQEWPQEQPTPPSAE